MNKADEKNRLHLAYTNQACKFMRIYKIFIMESTDSHRKLGQKYRSAFWGPAVLSHIQPEVFIIWHKVLKSCQLGKNILGEKYRSPLWESYPNSSALLTVFHVLSKKPLCAKFWLLIFWILTTRIHQYSQFCTMHVWAIYFKENQSWLFYINQESCKCFLANAIR